MALKSKILLFFLIVAVMYVTLLYLGTKQFIFKSFLQLEEVQAVKDLDRGVEFIINEIFNLRAVTVSLAVSKATFEFIQNQNAPFIHSNLTPQRFENANLFGIYLFNHNNELVWGKSYDKGSEEYVSDELYYDKLLSYAKQTNESLDTNSGLLLTQERIFILMISPVTKTHFDQDIGGVIITLREMDDEMVEFITESTHADLSIWQLNSKFLKPELLKLSESLKYNENNMAIDLSDENKMKLYSLIYDMDEGPALLVEISNDREISSKGKSVVKIIFIILVLSAPLTIIFLLVFLQVIARHE